jgi:hypothetical protein
MNCRFCGKKLSYEFIDLVNAPPSNAFLTKDQLNEPEIFYPLKLFVCDACFLVQIDEYKKSSDIFYTGYAYFSSYSTTWLSHAKNYVDMMVDQFRYDRNSMIIEIASNDGYLLQYFQEKNIPSLGIEPAEGTANEAKKKGIETIVNFFNSRLARSLAEKGRKADLLIGNNVLAHVPDINDFVSGLKILLKDKGVITMEFPHLLQLVSNNQFDTIYHEHFSYLSFYTVQTIFQHHGLDIFDVEELDTHGGSLRIFAKHRGDDSKKTSGRVSGLLDREDNQGMRNIDYYLNFQMKADKIKYDLVNFMIDKKRKSEIIVGYGAAAKGNTLLNYCGIKSDLIGFVVDASPHKQGKYLPGSHIPVVSENEIRRLKPDYVLILPWNIKSEIMEQLSYIRTWGGRFVLAVPELAVDG